MEERNARIATEVKNWAAGELKRQLELLETDITGQKLYETLEAIQHTANIAQKFISGLEYF